MALGFKTPMVDALMSMAFCLVATGFNFAVYLSDWSVLGGSWDLVSTVISTSTGFIDGYKYSYTMYNPTY